MIVKALDSIWVFYCVELCLNQVLLLALEERIALVVVPGCGIAGDVCFDLEVSLPSSDL